MVVDCLVSYGGVNTPTGGSRLPKWVYEQTINFPRHPRRSELIQEYETARLQHCELVEILQFAITTSQLTDSQKVVEVDACERRVQLAKQELQQAEEQLWDFNHHTPQQRIGLIQLQIADLEMQLLEVHALEQRYVNQLLDDPELNRRKLDRLVHGYIGVEGEYLPEQLDELRSLRGKIQSIEAAIINYQRDIEQIQQLADQQRKIEEVQAAVNAILPKFSTACSEFCKAWTELQKVAGEHDIDISHDLKIPNSVTFEQNKNQIILMWE